MRREHQSGRTFNRSSNNSFDLRGGVVGDNPDTTSATISTDCASCNGGGSSDIGNQSINRISGSWMASAVAIIQVISAIALMLWLSSCNVTPAIDPLLKMQPAPHSQVQNDGK